ncbi:phosphomannomutase/phosphoglucomutase [Candidatus Roizmanbacteria bacterium]|nr:MAG: phosphomannomutase/phosphoglucomutase [Candidatus Roizmanbacteria bacterium]
MIDTKIFKAYDIRGIYPAQINEEVMEDIMRAIYTFLAEEIGKKDFSIVLGRDMRLSSPALHEIAKETLKKSGAHVIDVGLVSTPTVYFTVKQYDYDAGIQISASHNPKDYNGIKIVRRDGDSIVKIGKETGMPKITELATNKQFSEYTYDGTTEEKPNIIQEEVNKAMDAIDVGDISELKIVADPANAMGIIPLKEMFDRLDTEFITINFELDGTFPAHQADPLQHKTLRQLQDKVKETGADLGICTDGDADRAMFINEKGEIIPATLITTLIAGEILRDEPGSRVLVDIRYIRNVEDIVKQMGGEVGYTPVGHALITKQVNAEDAVFAGESSGHYYFRSMGGCESTIRVILYVLRVLAREKKPISEILLDLETSVESGETNFELEGDTTSSQVTEKLKETFADGELSTLDGIAITYPEWRFSVRSSNTEPVIRLNVEGKTSDVVNEKETQIKKMILDMGAKIVE